MKVDAKEYKYAVVQFVKRPHQDIGDFVCIPHSWIRIRRATDEQSIVAYPNERPSVTRRRIEDGENPSGRWTLYLAIVKLETNTYKEAKDYILKNKYRVTVTADDLCSSSRNKRNSTELPQRSESQLDAVMNKLNVVKSTNGGSLLQNNISQAENTSNIVPTKNPTFVYPHIQKIPDYCFDNSPENCCEEIGKKSSYLSRELPQRSESQLDAVMNKLKVVKSTNGGSLLQNNISQAENTSNIVPTKNPTFVYPHIQKIPDYCFDNSPENCCEEIGKKSSYLSRELPQRSESQLDAVMNKLKVVKSTNGGSLLQNNISQAENTSNIVPTKNPTFVYPHIQKIPDYCFDNSPENCCEEIGKKSSYLSRELPQRSESQLDAVMNKLKVVKSTNGGSLLQNNISQAENTSNIVPTKNPTFVYPHIQKIPDYCFDNSPENCCEEIGKKSSYLSRELPQRSESQLDAVMNKLKVVKSTNGGSLLQNNISQAENTSNIVPTKNPTFVYPHIQKIPDYCFDNSPENCCEEIGKKSSYLSRELPQRSESQLDAVMNKLKVVKSTNGGSLSQNNISQAENTSNIVPTKNPTFVYPHIQKIPDYCFDNSPENCCEEEIGKKSSYLSRDMLNSMKRHLLGLGRSPQVPTENISEQSSEQNKSPRLSLDDERSQDSDIQAMVVDEPEVTQDDSDQSSPTVCTEADQPNDYPINEIRKQADFLANLFNTMETSYANSSKRILEVHKSFDRSAELLKVIKKTYNAEKLKQNKETAAEVEETPEMRKDDNAKSSGNDEEDDSEDDKPLKKPRDSLRKFVLPPDYDPKDTRWTLKYPQNDPELGLVELRPGSNVYVNYIKLAHCERVSKDCKTLARKLLAEIFSLSALSVCSLTGAKANAFHNNGTYVRPGLDEKARMTMLEFVEDYARKQQWVAYDKQSVINSVRSRIQEIRRKQARTART